MNRDNELNVDWRTLEPLVAVLGVEFEARSAAVHDIRVGFRARVGHHLGHEILGDAKAIQLQVVLQLNRCDPVLEVGSLGNVLVFADHATDGSGQVGEVLSVVLSAVGKQEAGLVVKSLPRLRIDVVAVTLGDS